MALHQQGYYIAEIAKKYELSPCTVYLHLQEIADANGVSRESLLQVVRTPSERQYKEEERRIQVNIEELKKGFSDLDESFQRLITTIDNILEEEKSCAN